MQRCSTAFDLDTAGPLLENRGREDNKMRSKIYAAVAAVLLALAALPQPAHAQGSFPNKTVKFIVPFPAGGINDVLARIAADKLQAKWGQAIIIEQKTGAGGNIGADLAAQAEPDGHTILVAPPGPLAVNQSLYRKLSYKPEDFVPITMLGSVANVTIVKKELPVNSLQELIEHVKKNPGKMIYASQGNGATPHLTANMFMGLTGTSMVHVPYRGETLVLQDMLGGHVDLFFGNVAGVLSLWRDGKVKVLAVLDKKRARQMPDVPTTAEAGLPALVSTAWFAVAGPPKLPAALQQQIAAAFNDVLKMPDVQEKYRNLGVEPTGGSPAEAAAFIKDEARRWGEVIKANNIVVD
jgi:tripartite-type tricarboxylate transporter receptor subunit TctC